MKQEYVFVNANVMTMDDNNPFSDSIVIRDGKIVSLNAGDASERAVTVNCGGRTILPGFIDAHLHLHAFAERNSGYDLASLEVMDIEHIQGYISQIVSSKAPGEWITVYGYDPSKITEKRNLTKEDLDPVSADNPVRLLHCSGYGELFNSRALDIMGINICSEDPDGGMIERDVPSGEPTGMLYSMSRFTSKFIPKESREELEEKIRLCGRKLASVGITSVNDTGVNNDFDKADEINEWSENGLLPQRICVTLGFDTYKMLFDGIDFLLSVNPIINAVKIVLTQTRGTLNFSKERLTGIFYDLQADAIPAAVHCVDEEQLDAVVSAIETAVEKYPDSPVRHRIEHASLCSDEMADRISKLGIAVVSQPAFLYYNGDRYLNTIDFERQKLLYPFGRLCEKGVLLAGSSDAPITAPSPLMGMYSAITRKTRTGNIVNPGQKISLKDAAKMFTINAAKVLNIDNDLGSLTPGKRADIVILEGIISEDRIEDLENMRVALTMIDGEVVWKA